MDRENQPGKVSDDTVAEEQREANTAARADRPPTDEEAAAAEQNEVDPKVAKAFQEAGERGAHLEGEGQIGG